VSEVRVAPTSRMPPPPEWLRSAIVEGIGPFTLVFVGAGAIIATGGTNLVAIALAHGLAIGLMVAAAGHISGGVYNPALTVGLVLGRRISVQKGAVYIAAQLIGATIAALALKYLFPAGPREAVHLGTPLVNGAFSSTEALVFEVVMTFFLMFAVYGTAVDPRGPRAIAPLVIGLIITMDIFVGGAATGAAMNPSRAFGPALIDNIWTDHWIYWIGPIIGAAIAAVLYEYVLLQPEGSGP
jgi:MIP family channel proteins